MYEYSPGITVPQKNPTNQSGGSITRVIVEEKFDEAGRLVSRTTTTEYDNSAKTPYWPHAINVTS